LVRVEDSPNLPDEAIEEKFVLWNETLQNCLSNIIIEDDLLDMVFSRICAVDVAYKDLQDRTISAACAVITDDTGRELAYESVLRTSPRIPYISGHFSLRELPCVLEILSKMNEFDLLLLDCNGRLHPRRFGMACHAGVCVSTPTIGVAKSLLCGMVLSSPFDLPLDGKRARCYPVSLDGEIIGAQLLITKIGIGGSTRAFYISVGNLISLSTAVMTISHLIQGYDIIPLKLAHEKSLRILQESE